jgi:carboxylesterase 2/para-nitrobenzyl esterase
MASSIERHVHPIVETRHGRLRGQRSNGVVGFKGVPYAAPPFGRYRLRPPQPVEPWNDVRDALRFGPKPPHGPYPPGIAEGLGELVDEGEDCLSLNIWTPGTDTSGLPVMLWIPGGMFEFHGTGATPYYDGSRFARDGVICVTINYRLGAEGFLYLGDGIANLGLLDQIAALEWVHDNIAVFGGDANELTIFGQSAGGMSVATLLSMPRTKGMFRRAIVQSGNTPNVNSAGTAARIGARLAETLGIVATRDAFADVPWKRLLQAQAQLRDELLANPDPEFWNEVAISYLPWAPVVDGDTVPAPPIERIRSGAGADVDLLVGSNTEETRLFFVTDGSINRITDDAVAALAAGYRLPPNGLAAYRAAYPEASPGELFSAIQTDGYWRVPAIRMADAHASAARSDTYMYEFAWRSPRLGAAHGVEIPFVFDTLGLGTEPMLGPEPPQSLAAKVHAAWVAFAVSADCGWAKYESAHRLTMRFDSVSRVVRDPLAARLELWNGVR